MAKIEFSQATQRKAAKANGDIRKAVAALYDKTFSVVSTVLSSDYDQVKSEFSTVTIDQYLTSGEYDNRINRLIPLCVEKGAVASSVRPVIACIRSGVRRKEDFDSLVTYYGDVVNLANAVKNYSVLFSLHALLVRVGLLTYADKKARSEGTARFAAIARLGVIHKQDVTKVMFDLMREADMPEQLDVTIAMERIKTRSNTLSRRKITGDTSELAPLTWESMLPKTSAAVAGA